MNLREKIARIVATAAWGGFREDASKAYDHADKRGQSEYDAVADSILAILTNPDEETVERVARSLAVIASRQGTPVEGDKPEDNWEAWIEEARAALSSLGEG